MKMITILGPTASGKTAFAALLAYKLGAEIISADSRQVYRGMDIGTGKDLADYKVNNTDIPYHLIDIEEPGTRYDLFRYQQAFSEAYRLITEGHQRPVVFCGGTGLYIEAVLKGYALSPVPQNETLRNKLKGRKMEDLKEILAFLKHRNHTEMHNTTDVDSTQRAIRAIEIELHNRFHPIPNRQMNGINSLVVGVNIDREERRRKISQRLKTRLDEGLIDEVKLLLARGIAPDDLIYYGLEYKYVTEHVIGKTDYEEMYRQLEIAIHQFAKRQMTWFRGMERRGTHIHWIDAKLDNEEKVRQVMQLLNEHEGINDDTK